MNALDGADATFRSTTAPTNDGDGWDMSCNFRHFVVNVSLQRSAAIPDYEGGNCFSQIRMHCAVGSFRVAELEFRVDHRWMLDA